MARACYTALRIADIGISFSLKEASCGDSSPSVSHTFAQFTVNSAVESSRPLIQQCGHELSVILPSEPLQLDADPIRLAQVFANLLNNAAKYTKRGGHIWLTVEREGSDAVVSVRDDGIGVSSEMLSPIFDMFTQVDGSLERSQGGLGIGLTLVRRLVEMHDGSIEANSTGRDAGSEFIVRLPLYIAPPDGCPIRRDAPKPTALSKCRILVVDDNKDSADTLGMLLRIKGNDIRSAHDGLEALEVAESFRPQIILLDIGLPKLNGYDVARRIRQQPWGRDMTLVALRSHNEAINITPRRLDSLPRLQGFRLPCDRYTDASRPLQTLQRIGHLLRLLDLPAILPPAARSPAGGVRVVPRPRLGEVVTTPGIRATPLRWQRFYGMVGWRVKRSARRLHSAFSNRAREALCERELTSGTASNTSLA